VAQSARDKKLETRSARLRLATGRRYFKAIGEGLTLVYRRTGEGFGTWSAKVAQPGGRYVLRAIGAADDYEEANDVDVLTFWQAQERARVIGKAAKHASGRLEKPLTVSDAADAYLTWFLAHRRSVRETEHTIDAHIRPALGEKHVNELTPALLPSWLEKVATDPARVRTSAFAGNPKYRAAPATLDQKRARRATANRILTVLKALLNRAFHDGRVGDDTAWRKVKPFAKADEPRVRFLTDGEAVRLVNACEPDMRRLVRAGLLSGARLGELTGMRVTDVNLRTRQVYIAESKSSRPRHVPLNAEGLEVFREAVTGKTADELVFTKADGAAWKKNHHVRALAAACRVASVRPAISFHELRHTYASHLAQAGVDLLTISKLLGHADTGSRAAITRTWLTRRSRPQSPGCRASRSPLSRSLPR